MEKIFTAGRLVIVGAGGFGREVLDVVDAINASGGAIEFLGFLDDGPVNKDLLEVRGATVLGGSDRIGALDCAYVVGVVDPSVRRRFDGQFSAVRLPAAVLVHPSATVGSQVTLGPGSIICAQASITTNVAIGRHCHLNLHATVGHDTTIGSYVTLMPGANLSGSVVLGDDVTVGTGASVIQNLNIGAGSYVGAGAAVVRDVEAGTTVVGVPARPR